MDVGGRDAGPGPRPAPGGASRLSPGRAEPVRAGQVPRWAVPLRPPPRGASALDVGRVLDLLPVRADAAAAAHVGLRRPRAGPSAGQLRADLPPAVRAARR